MHRIDTVRSANNLQFTIGKLEKNSETTNQTIIKCDKPKEAADILRKCMAIGNCLKEA